VKTVSICLLYAVFILIVPSAGAQFRYEFQDRPSPEANVMVVEHSLRQGSSAEIYLVGRVFNRGLKSARNVRIVYLIRNPDGAQLPGNPIYLTPSDIPPTSYADFQGRRRRLTMGRGVNMKFIFALIIGGLLPLGIATADGQQKESHSVRVSVFMMDAAMVAAKAHRLFAAEGLDFVVAAVCRTARIAM